MDDTINQIARARDMARLMGWRECRVVAITVDDGRAELRIRYLMGPMHKVRPGDPEDGMSIDMTDMPAGVDVLSQEAPPDDVFALPGRLAEDDVRAISAALGRPDITRGDRSDGVTIYWMDR